MPMIDVTENDLVIIVPNDSAPEHARTKVYVGSRQIGLLQSITLRAGVNSPAVLTAEFPPDHVMEAASLKLNLSLVAYQALLEPWVNPQRGSSPGATLWQRLADED